MRFRAVLRCLTVSSLLCAALPALPALPAVQDGEPLVSPADVEAFESWLEAYTTGRIQLVSDGKSNTRELARVGRLMRAVARGGDLVAVRRLWPAAIVDLPAEVDKFARLGAQVGSVRAMARERIGAIGGAEVDAWLVARAAKRGGGKSGEIARLAAVEILGMRASPGLGDLILARLMRFSVRERVQAVLALEKVGTPKALPRLLEMLDEREPNLRVAVVEALGGILGPLTDERRSANLEPGSPGMRWKGPVVEALVKLLAKERVWQVRAAAGDCLVALKTKLAIPALIGALRAEIGAGGRGNRMLASSLHDGLESLTGQDLPERRPDLWQQFWANEKATFRFAPARRRHDRGGHRQREKRAPAGEGSGYAKYFNIDIKSRRVLFVIDFSGSMAEKVALSGRYAGSESEHVKYELVKTELEKVVRALPKTAICNVIFFNDKVGVWRTSAKGKPALVKMSDANKSALLQYVWETAPSGATNVYGALETALAIGDRGLYDKYYGVAYDTLFFLSDGAPTFGQTTDTAQIRAAVRRVNKLRRIRIHTIVFGNEKNNLSFMRKLAEENGGQFLRVQ